MAEQLSEYITLDDDYLENCMNKSSNDQFGEDLISYFLTQNNNPNAESFGLAAIEAKCDGEITSLSDYIAQVLDDLLGEDPFLLLEIDCDQIQKWQTLAQHTAPQSVQDKIDDLHDNNEALLGDWEIQYLEDAGGTAVNLDYFGVNITTLPNNPVTEQQFTANEFLDYFRRNINCF